MLKKILVAIDGSAASGRAFNKALELAQALNAELTLVHALDVFDPASPERPDIAMDSYSVQLDKALQDAYAKEWAQYVEHYEALLRQRQEEATELGVATYSVQPYGRPGPAICATAKKYEIDLIVVGSRGHRGLTELLLGSVSNYIMHHAPCSVTVVHHQDQETAETVKEHASVAVV